MKKLITILTLLLLSQVLRAQAPQATSYQAVIRNSSGNVLSSQLVKVRFSIRDSAANGTIVYQETQTPTTNAQGLINLFAGQGTAVTGTFAGINWGNKSKFLQTEIDIAGGNNYTDMGTTQLMSVPYALYSNNGLPTGTSNGDILYWNGTIWVKVTPGTYGQSLTICDGVPTWGGCSPKITSTAASTISYTTATSGGNVTAEGGVSVTSRGVCWSTTINPTIALATKTVNGTGTGAFTSSITGLIANTTYYVRAYATNSVGTAYGTELTFTTLVTTIPTLTTTAASAITATTATSGGNITSDNGSTITARGICWSITANPTTALTTKTVDGIGTGTFTSSITGLISNTTYYVRAYATNSVGTAYGTELTFTTLATVIPTVTTTSISNISNTRATSGGNVSSDGNASITARGVCWSTTINPTVLLATKTVDGTGTGAFTSSITGLTANTTYYVRAYATNSVGTAYGSQQTFITTNEVVVALPSVTIGTQVWTTQNLSVARYRNGDLIPQVTNATQWAALTTGAWCWYNNDSATYAATYGRLYNWYAVNDARGLAPQGWHIPSDAEWTTLETTLGGSSVAGGAMKSTTGWNAPNTGATNSSGFASLPGGRQKTNGTFDNIGNYGFLWSSTEYNTANAWYRQVNYNSSSVFRSASGKTYGFSVRCVRD